MPAPSSITTTPVDRFLDEDQSLACIHCGLCLSSCPTYLETGNENDSPRGRIYQMRALQSGALPMNKETVKHIDLCLGCRACEAACPSGVQYGALLESTREHIDSVHDRGWVETFIRRVLIEGVFPHPERVELALMPAQALKRLGIANWLPASLRRFVDLVPATSTARVPLPRFSPAIGGKVGTAAFFSGCVMDVMFNQTNLNSIHLLNLAGYDVVVPSDQVCCGALHAHGGRLDAARQLAKANLRVFDSGDFDVLVVNAAGCGSTLKEYDHLLRKPSMAGSFSRRVLDLAEILAASERLLSILAKASSGGPRKRVTYHAACHLQHAQGVSVAPVKLVRLAAGDGFVPLIEWDVCCGSAGSYNLTEPAMADRLKARKAGHLRQSNAELVVSTNPGCLLQLASANCSTSDAQCLPLHLADYLAEVLDSV